MALTQKSQEHREAFKRNVRLLLALKGQSKSALGRALGISPAGVDAALEAPTDYQCRRFAKALGVRMGVLWAPDLQDHPLETIRRFSRVKGLAKVGKER